MSARHYKLMLPASSQKIRQAKANLKNMSPERQIELMVAAGVMNVKQAAKAKKSVLAGKVVK
jgi:hypothetical protein